MNSEKQTERANSLAELAHVADFAEGVKLLKNGYPKKALECLKRAYECEKQNPYYISFLGLSLARAEQKWDQAVELCQSALHLKRTEIQFHLNLADVYLHAGERGDALDTLDAALELLGENERLRSVRTKIEKRRTVVFDFLPRESFFNRQLGNLRHRVLRRLGKQDPQ